MKPMGGRTWKYWPASGPFFFSLGLQNTQDSKTCGKDANIAPEHYKSLKGLSYSSRAVFPLKKDGGGVIMS